MSLINEFSRIPNFLKVTESGSMTLIGNLIVTNGISASGGLTGSYSISIPGLISGSSQVLSSLPAGTISGSTQLTSSFEIKGSGIVSGSSQITTLLPTGVVSGSAQTIANLPTGVVSGSSQVDVMSTTNINKLATTGSNTFFGTQTYSGSVYIANDLIVQGSSSIQYISASSVSIGTNIVQLNTANPSVRYAGLSIVDSGSIGGSGSFLYDSVQDEFIFVHRGDGVNVTSSHFVLGPETYNSLGNETYLSNNRLPKGTGKEHLVDSNITDTGTLITLASNTTITGTLSVTGTTLVSGSSQIDVMSTTNIARLATTGSNIFIANQTINGNISAGATNYSYVGPSQYGGVVFPRGQLLFSNTNGQNQMYISSNAYTNAGGVFSYRNSAQPAGFMAIDNGAFSIGLAGNGTADANITFITPLAISNAGVSTFGGNVIPDGNGTRDLGSAAARWSTVYTSDLSLNNGIGDWTIVEGEDDLFLYNNKKGKVYKFALTEVEPNTATPKKS